MTLIGITLVVLLAVAAGYSRLRRRAPKKPQATVASYTEIKRRIRAGNEDGPAVLPPTKQSAALPISEILKLHDSNHFVSAVFDRVSLKADRGDSPLSPIESAVLHIWWLEAEVNNGGFDQYFFNSAGDGAAQALAGLELIGADKAATITRRAMNVFGAAGPARDRGARWLQLDELDGDARATLDELSDGFQSYPDPLPDLIMKRCRAEPRQLT